MLFVGAYCRGQRREDQERDYLENYYPTDERVPRFPLLPDSHLVHVEDLFTAEELKSSPTYNEMLLRAGGQDSLNARLDGPDGSSITWGLRDPVDAAGWGASRVATVTKLLPHIRQFVRVRQALVRAEARDTTVTALLDNPRIGVLHLDRRGRILGANDRARAILRNRDGLTDRDGMLGARAPADQVRLERIVGDALPGSGPAAVSGSMLLRRSPVLPPFVVHVKPVRVPQPDYGAHHRKQSLSGQVDLVRWSCRSPNSREAPARPRCRDLAEQARLRAPSGHPACAEATSTGRRDRQGDRLGAARRHVRAP